MKIPKRKLFEYIIDWLSDFRKEESKLHLFGTRGFNKLAVSFRFFPERVLKKGATREI